MVEEMYVEETKEQETMGSTSDTTDKNGTGAGAAVGGGGRSNPQINNIISKMDEDLKPTHEQLVRIDSECLSSIIHNDKINVDAATDDDDHHQQIMQQNNNMNGYTFGAVDVDFSSSYAYGGGGGGGVSLTLGLQQHGGGGGDGGEGGVVSLGFSSSPTNNQNSLFYSREHIENCPAGVVVPVQYSSLLDSETQNLPYRNLMGAQLLHDLAG